MKKQITLFAVLTLFVIVNAFSQTPYILFSEIEESYDVDQEIAVTALVYSDGFLDQLCGVYYAIYKDGEPIQNLHDYGSIEYTVRAQGTNYHTGQIEEGSGMIQINYLFWTVGAFTLGMFDNDCVDRNRPLEFTIEFFEPGNYYMEFFIHSCTNSGTPTGTSFVAVNCDGEEYSDRIDVTCENPTELNGDSFELEILGPPSEEADILVFEIPNQIGSSIISNETPWTVEVLMPFGTDVTDLTPTISVSEFATINPESEVSHNFENPVVYTVTAQDEITTKDYTVTVNVAEDVYHTITFEVVEVNGFINGTIQANADGMPISSPYNAYEGANIVFTAIPDLNFIVKEWTINGDIVPDFVDNELTIEDINTDKNITVEFEMYVKHDIVKNNLVSVYPNPNNGVFTINNIQEIISYEIYSASGVIIEKNNEIDKNEVDITLDLSPGVYFLRLFNSEDSSVIKIYIY